jgi:spermidine synthase
MKPWETIDTARAPDGTPITLQRHDREYVIRGGRDTLMSSRSHGSEEAMAVRACAALGSRAAPRVLVGGLGMGFTLRAALNALPADAAVVVAELIPEVVAWHEGPLGPLADHPLRDPRVQVTVGDVRRLLHDSPNTFDAILLDVDNGPAAFASAGNAGLYGDAGLAALRTALTVDGVLALWSAWEDRGFARRLRAQGFAVSVERVRARAGRGGARHVVYLAR